MARPKNDPGDTFGYSELATAGDMTPRALQHIEDADLLPPGRGIRQVKRMAFISALLAVGVPLLLAGRIAKEVTELEFNTKDGEVPSGLEQLILKAAKERPGIASNIKTWNDYWLHRELHQDPEQYTPGQAYPTDVLIEIVDQRLVFRLPWLPELNPFTGSAEKVSFVGWIDWKRGEAVHLSKKIKAAPDDPAWRAQGKRLLAEIPSIRQNAVAKVTINVSLAIRNALDRIARHRDARITKGKKSKVKALKFSAPVHCGRREPTNSEKSDAGGQKRCTSVQSDKLAYSPSARREALSPRAAVPPDGKFFKQRRDDAVTQRRRT